MGSFQRFSTGFVLANKVSRIPENIYNLTRTECLAQSIRAIPGVVDVRIRRGKFLCYWRAELEIGTTPKELRPQIKAAIKRCCRPANHQPKTYITMDEAEDYCGFAGI